MYCEWASLEQEIQGDFSTTSVLHKFPEVVGRDVAGAVVKNLAQSLSHGASTGQPSALVTDREVQWTMEVLCYGLSLPMQEHETMRDCVNVYCEWMTALTQSKACVPPPVAEDPNPYARVMLHHLHNLFVPRHGTPSDLVTRQVLLCHRVLRTIQGAATGSTILTRETWSHLLKFLLAINDSLLGPPLVKDGIGDQLCERVLSVLFEMWLLACSKCFPSPLLWKTFRNMCAQWRHHPALVAQWHRVNLVLTSHLLKVLYGPDFPPLHVVEDDSSLVPSTMDNDCISQCWFRFLHILGNPVDLGHPMIISQTPKFLHQALTSEKVVEPHQHECLRELPTIFYQAMRGLSVLVDAFLGMAPPGGEPELTQMIANSVRHSIPPTKDTVTPPVQRRTKTVVERGSKGVLSKNAAASALVKQSSSAASTPSSSPAHRTLDSRPPLAPTRPTVNSILHLFGAWLVEAALTGVHIHGNSPKDDGDQLPNQYEAGRAEACGALCRIFCSRKTGEDILPVYLARFYVAVHYGLETCQNLSGTVLANIIFNSCDLLRIDLDGVQVLVPQMLQALEFILTDLKPRFDTGSQIPAVELRKASIHLLLSMLCLPLHFKELTIRSLFGETSLTSEPELTFASLKVRIIELLLRALTVENDSSNTHMLLGGLLLNVEDLALCEEAEQTMLQEVQDLGGPPSPTVTNTYNDSAHGLFGHAASLVCNRLMASWKMELNIALAAIEVLAGLAKIKLNKPNLLMCKRTVNWICEFIVYQCSRPAPAHSKDLHSMIVAAFHCLTVWLVEHEALLQDKECLQAVLEVVELGISGAKSQPEMEEHRERPTSFPHKHKHDKEHKSDKADREQRLMALLEENRASDIPKLKGSKELKPVSMRVKDAAEALLTAIMDHVGSFPPPCGPESVYSLLDEDSLLKYNKDGSPVEQMSPFRYFVLDGTTIVGLLEQPLGNDQEPLPTVTAIVRGPFGRHAWTSQLRHMPRNKKTPSKAVLSEPKRPTPRSDVGIHYNVKQRYFPPLVDTIPLVKADKSIPALSSIMTEEAEELNKLSIFIQEQVVLEQKLTTAVQAERKIAPFPDPETECKPPSICHDFQTARLFLSHYGFLSLEALKEPSSSSVPPSLVQLDSMEAGFLTDLQQLDALPCRTADTVHVFYVKSGQKMPFEILSNVNSKHNVDASFLEFLRSLGWPVDVKKHAGWTGHVSTSWRIQSTDEEDEIYPGDTGGKLYDGRQQVLYWADVMSEVAFVVPSPDTYQANGRRSSVDSTGASEKLAPLPVPEPTSARGGRSIDLSQMKPKSLSLDFDKPPEPSAIKNLTTPTEPPSSSGVRMRRFGKGPTAAVFPEAKIFVVWLESFEDHENFPAEDLVASTSTGLETQGSTSSSSLSRSAAEPPLFVIYIHALQSGLFRIHMQGPSSRMNLAVPLVDGMVVSRRAMGLLVRQTAINISRRRRLENETYQPPHVKRKVKVKEIVDKYRNKMSEAEFYTSLFQDTSK